MKRSINTTAVAAILVCTTLGLATAARAADDHKGHDHGSKAAKHEHEAKPAYGGVVTVVKDVNYELVAKGDSIALYVTDHGKPADLKNGSAKLTLMSGADVSNVALTPAGDRLEAKGAFKVGPGTKVVAQVSAGGAATSVRFTLK